MALTSSKFNRLFVYRTTWLLKVQISKKFLLKKPGN
ncbi:MAG: hypothetical protein JWP37_740 [Mucilaginibacter sp.]|nr:hypothetical protein [Mucilaginibacter sp.]